MNVCFVNSEKMASFFYECLLCEQWQHGLFPLRVLHHVQLCIYYFTNKEQRTAVIIITECKQTETDPSGRRYLAGDSLTAEGVRVLFIIMSVADAM